MDYSKIIISQYQAAGELMERLGTRAGLEIDWVGMKPG